MSTDTDVFKNAHYELEAAIDDMQEGTDLLVRLGNNNLYEDGNEPTAAELAFLYEKLQEQAAKIRKCKNTFWEAIMDVLRREYAAQQAEEAARKPAQVYTLRLVGGDGEPAA